MTFIKKKNYYLARIDGATYHRYSDDEWMQIIDGKEVEVDDPQELEAEFLDYQEYLLEEYQSALAEDRRCGC